jgi:DNA repair exonuclease SbcCD ATPase subunit
MKIEKIVIKNFYSIRDAELCLSEYSGLTLIKGINKDAKGSNGSGKSVLLEAILFGLTGKTIRKSTEDSLVNNKAKKLCTVQLHILKDNEYIVITRKKKPSSLEFLLGDNNLTKATVAQTQAAIDETLNTNYKVLVSSMFFGQSNDISFLDSTADDKRNIIKTFLNLDDVFSMRDRIKGHKAEAYQSMKLQDSLVSEQERSITDLKKKLKAIEDDTLWYTNKYNKDTLSLSLDDILNGENKYRDTNFKISAYKKEIDANTERLEDLEYKAQHPNSVEVCPRCKQDIVVKHDPEQNALDIGNIAIDTMEMKIKLKDLQSTLWEPPISSREFSKILKYKDLCRDEETFTSLIQEYTEKILQYQKDKSSSKIDYDVMRFWEKALSEQGVIKYIIRNVLEYFNDRCNFYLSYLTNSNYFVEFDSELVEKITTNGTIIQYISLSGGEKRKINLAIMLALKDLLLLTDKDQSDLVFFDEVAENLDEEGVRGLHELLQEIKKDKTIFVITHNKHLKTLLDSAKRLTVIKHKGITKLKA